MVRSGYALFSAGRIGRLVVRNRLVRSATWDPAILKDRRMTAEVLEVYRRVAVGGVGLIISGDFPVVPAGMLEEAQVGGSHSYRDIKIEGLDRLVEVVREADPDCRIVAQLEAGTFGVGPSAVPSPFLEEPSRPLSLSQIHAIVARFVEAIVYMHEIGFDGIQLHGAHGGLLSCFLSPYTNRRQDVYGGSAENRVRIVREIVAQARDSVGDFPILIKANCTDYLPGGLDRDNFPEQAQELERADLDAIELSGGMWDCLVRSEEELGFRPVPAPESHTRIGSAEKQSYFLPYAESLSLDIPLILVGGNRQVDQLERIVQQGRVDFIALCRPLISEPDLPKRWLEGRGRPGTDCVSCNSCIHDLIMHPGRSGPGAVRCVFKEDKAQYKQAQEWLSSWVQENRVR